jgi:hypothetical protein
MMVEGWDRLLANKKLSISCSDCHGEENTTGFRINGKSFFPETSERKITRLQQQLCHLGSLSTGGIEQYQPLCA